MHSVLWANPTKNKTKTISWFAPGQATRIAPSPCSKELYPIGFRRLDEDGSLRPNAVCHYLLEKMRLASITRAYISLREGKWDIPAYFGEAKCLEEPPKIW